jgi:hypothetical protein
VRGEGDATNEATADVENLTNEATDDVESVTSEPCFDTNNKDGIDEEFRTSSDSDGAIPTGAKLDARRVIDRTLQSIKERRQTRGERIRQLHKQGERAMAQYRAEKKAGREARKKKDTSAQHQHEHERKAAEQEMKRLSSEAGSLMLEELKDLQTMREIHRTRLPTAMTRQLG